MGNSIIEILGYVFSSGALGGVLGWIFSKRKYNAEVKTVEVNNFDAALSAYKKMYDDLIDEYKNKNNDLQKEVESLKTKLAATEKQVITLTNYILAQAMKVPNDISDLKGILDNNNEG